MILLLVAYLMGRDLGYTRRAAWRLAWATAVRRDSYPTGAKPRGLWS